MINILLIVDETDEELGNFFESCAQEIKKLFCSAVITELKSNMIQNDIVINQRISEIQNDFIFIGFTHGSDCKLLGSKNDPYIAIGKNEMLFNGSLFYCFACNTGKTLGKKIIDNKGRCFIGHNRKIYANNIGNWRDLFIQPILCFWRKFISGSTVLLCLKEKHAEYTRLIDCLYETDMFHAAYLLENRDSLVLYGDENCSINDFSILK
jgi:hypothetical protein